LQLDGLDALSAARQDAISGERKQRNNHRISTVRHKKQERPMMRKTLLIPMLGTVAALGAAPAIADDYYFGVRGGLTANTLGGAEVADSLNAIPGTNVAVDIDESDTGYEVFGGMRVGDHLYVEASYVNFGDFDMHISGTAVDPDAVAQQAGDEAPMSGSAARLGLRWLVPVTKHVRLLPRIGAFYYSSDTDVTTATDSFSSDNDGFGGTMGFGGGYAFDNGLMLSLGWDFFMGDDESSVGLFGAAAEYGF